ncbi:MULTISPECIES: TrbI/VirB10 family protein [unclassified Paraburkholderia]|uniref:TrbI/VirB10 family protein n=1 Tax=unclassified Paraburkholderia TaxID=2615204 RepID=UPI002AAF4F51|nr:MULTISPECIES: TrbI/VirB10 family protein [unclassified Paraburkholderia]
MSDQYEDEDSPFAAENPSRRRVDRSDIPESSQSPDREPLEDLTRGKRKRGKTAGFILVVALLAGALYYVFVVQGKSGGHHKKDTDTLTPSDAAGTNVVQQAKQAGLQLEQQRNDEAAAAAKRHDPNAAAAATIGGMGGPQSALALPANGASAAAEAAAAEEKKELEARAEKAAEIAAAPLEATNVQTLRASDATAASGATASADDMTKTLTDQLKANQAAADKQFDRAMKQAETSTNTSNTASATSTATSRASQEDQWLAAQKADDSEATRMHAAPSSPVVGEGTPVRAVLITGLDTDLPGSITAMITSDVYDTVTGQQLMIPKGSRLSGQYSHDIKEGQERVLIAMTRLVRPDGSWIDLSGTTGAEMDGSSGLVGDVNNHFWKIFGSALVIGAATLLVDRADTNVTVSTGASTTQEGGTIFAQTLQQVVQNLLQKNENIAPTITRDGGTQFIFLVRHDLAFTPYNRT